MVQRLILATSLTVAVAGADAQFGTLKHALVNASCDEFGLLQSFDLFLVLSERLGCEVLV